ncbi:hypothetical protein GCM10011519_18130 [Marmoricola endophyticus]|uniref:Uncharacterized protein n=1 Tax=Marmoricola endophyticus TaxID=2040280 RepID=A0A917BIS8_9ACTN|nr:hypothetical protein GCM10011519_18130 [Marmoricola endophyticus]
MGTSKETSADAAARFAQKFAKASSFPAATSTKRGTFLQPQIVNDGALRGKVKVATLEQTFGSTIHTYAMGYISGDFALQLFAACGKNQWKANIDQIEQFLQNLYVSTTY